LFWDDPSLRTTPLVLILTFVSAAAAAPTATVADGKITVTGVTSPKGLSVVVAEGTEADIAARPPVAGDWKADEGKVVFTPKYPLKAGTTYRVIGTASPLDVHTPKAERGKPTVVTHIYPSAAELPENVLRFYIEFNQPMPRGDSYRYVRLVSENGKADPLPFVELDQELWNADQTRLTLLIDPGRIKKEVKPRIDLGPVFRQGKQYTLVVSGKWPTLDGGTLGKDVSKIITATAPQSTGIEPKDWKVIPPINTDASLRVSFGYPLDYVILSRTLTVIGSDGQPVAGSAEPTDAEKGWRFQPTGRWLPGGYLLRVDTGLEDVSGNAVSRPFEVDLSRPPPKETKARHVDLPFTVGRR
jgi:hypothetical protein